MKKKPVVIGLAILGLVLLVASAVLTAAAFNRAATNAADVGIIGGADSPTLTFVFFRTSGGLYAILALLGVLMLAASLIVGLSKKKSLH